jgi:hypothetical protein
MANVEKSQVFDIKRSKFANRNQSEATRIVHLRRQDCLPGLWDANAHLQKGLAQFTLSYWEPSV